MTGQALKAAVELSEVSNQTPEWRAVTSTLSGYRLVKRPFRDTSLSTADIIALAIAILRVHPPTETDAKVAELTADLRAAQLMCDVRGKARDVAEAALSSQASVMEEMAKALEQSFEAAKPVAEAINRAANRGPDAKVSLTISDAMGVIKLHTAARTALSQYRTLGGE